MSKIGSGLPWFLTEHHHVGIDETEGVNYHLNEWFETIQNKQTIKWPMFTRTILANASSFRVRLGEHACHAFIWKVTIWIRNNPEASLYPMILLREGSYDPKLQRAYPHLGQTGAQTQRALHVAACGSSLMGHYTACEKSSLVGFFPVIFFTMRSYLSFDTLYRINNNCYSSLGQRFKALNKTTVNG